ncbi:MAG: SDR family oxidoreductase [Trueperaceae bacterium]|nr:SDR family oxidoreductase [Trueperaceae bacterium]
MDLQIAGKTALVTGASKGIGFAVASALAAEGARLVVNARDAGALGEAAERLRALGAEVHPVAGDVSELKHVKSLLAATKEAVGDPAILVANAGGPPTGPAETLDDAAWARGFELTLMSAVRLARGVVPAMKAAGWGRVVFVTSLSVKEPIANLTLSNAFRSGVTAFARTLANEVAEQGVTVNSVAPGYTLTERLDELFADDYARARLVSSIPARRFGAPEEIASAAAYLCSAQAAYVTGQTLLVDGGMVGATF